MTTSSSQRTRPRTLILKRNSAPYLKGIPADLTGKTVLDVGGFDGFYAGVCLQRGAASATVLDNGQYRGYTTPDNPDGWGEPMRWPGVEYANGDLLVHSAPADLVLCFNVIYHLSSPWVGCRALRRLTRERLLLVTSWLPGDEPVWHVTPDASGTIFWTPTVAGLASLLFATGFTDVIEIERWNDRVAVEAT